MRKLLLLILMLSLIAYGATDTQCRSTVDVILTAMGVSGGGTGLLTITDHSVMVGSGTSAVTPITVGTAGQVLLGAASADPVFTTIKDTDIIDIGACLNGASGPEALSTLTSTYSVEVRNFGPTADEDVYCSWPVPKDFTGGTVTYRVILWITNATGPSAEDISFFLQGSSVADGELLSKAHGSAVESKIDEGTHSQYDRVATAWSAAVTLTGIAAGETATLKLYRDADGGASDDDYEQDIGASKIEIKYSRALSSG